ncbi:LOW QUALITY PROTEIN: receptor-type tyrosine-protein phosphatase N2 [Pungitius pungitius]|uniref:LOW QUALITY PROTEIN: receptor-type tyrosine-protein phosphatase N2 n=1 Tax=Pungitius pungitius TaxID=134920 RepID=UPI002E0DF0F0
MDSPWCPVLLAALAVSLCSSPATADRKFGCLFEDELCSPYEFCVNGKTSGQCGVSAGLNSYQYDLELEGNVHLFFFFFSGLTWQDDITQQVISQELSKLRTIPLRHQASAPGPLTAHSSSRDGKLSRNLQQYLAGLGLLPQAEGKPGIQRLGSNAENDDIKSEGLSQPSRPKPQQGWKETTIYSHQKGAGRPPVTKVFTQSGEGRHPKLGATYSSREPGGGQLLGSHLERLLAEVPSAQQGAPSGKPAWPEDGKLRYLSYARPAPSDRVEPRPRVAFGPKTQKPNPDRLLFEAGSNQVTAEEPHGVMDERFIQSMVSQLGRHSINVEALMGKDLDQLAGVIKGVLQEVHEERPVAGARPGQGPADSRGGGAEGDGRTLAAVQQSRPQVPKPDEGNDLNEEDTPRWKQQGQQIDGAAKEPVDKHAAFFSKLLDYLNLEAFGDAPKVNPGPPAPLRKMVGLENVQSRTTQGQASVPVRWEEKTGPAKEGSALRLTAAAEAPGAQVDSEIHKWMQGNRDPDGKKQGEEPQKKDMRIKTQLVHVGVKEFSSRGKDRHFGYIITGSDSLTSDQGSDLMERLTKRLNLHAADLTQLSVLGPALTFRIGPNPKNVTTADLVQVAVQEKQQLEKETGLKIVEAGVSDRGSLTQIPVVKETRVESGQFLLLSVLCMLFILVALAVSTTFYCVRQRSHLRMKEKLASLGTDTSTDATATYQELCRQRMATRTSERVERPETLRHSRLNSVSSQFSDGPAASPSTRSSTSSWCEEPVPSNMDISTGHMILSYMEDHLKNKNRLEREWEALCSYQAEPSGCSVGRGEHNAKKNRPDAVVVYDHSRIHLKAENNHGNSDYINASPIMDHDPRNPTYISSQGPLLSTVVDFWQMVWESGCVVVVMLTPLSENGVKQCHPYWPDEGSDVYHVYEVNLVSEHIWCEDFLVRSFYLKNLQTNETRTVTQFHFLSWMDRGIPNSARTLLDFRRKVNKCYRGRSCPIIVHCSDGAGRSGTYILIDMVLNRMAKGAKEIDIAATLEHLRDQRAGMVQTKEQFEFALTAVAEEVNAILKALPQ